MGEITRESDQSPGSVPKPGPKPKRLPADALAFAQIHRNIHQGRINRSLQVVFGSLTFNALTVAAMWQRDVATSECIRYVVVAGFAVIAIIATIDFCTAASANKINQLLAENAETIAGFKLKKIKRSYPRVWTWIWETVIVWCGFAVSSYLVVNLTS